MSKTPEELALEVKTAFDTKHDQLKEIAEKALAEAEKGVAQTKTAKELADSAIIAMNEAKARLDEIEQKMARRGSDQREEVKSAGAKVIESEAFKSFVANGARGTARVQVKQITSVAGSAGELIQPRRDALEVLIREPLRIRALLNAVRVTTNAVEYPRVTGFTNNAAPVAETTLKPESSHTLEMETAAIRTIAHFEMISRQAMDDAPQIMDLIDTDLRWGLDDEEEDQILNGTGAGQNLKGLLHADNSVAYAAPFTVADGTMIDTLRLAILQSSLAQFPATGIVLNPIDWARIELTKDTAGSYIFANPTQATAQTLWALPVVATQKMAVDSFLTGAFQRAATIYDRMDTEVLVSTEDRDNFVKNMATVRAEKRLGLAVKRPEALVRGDFGNVA